MSLLTHTKLQILPSSILIFAMTLSGCGGGGGGSTSPTPTPNGITSSLSTILSNNSSSIASLNNVSSASNTSNPQKNASSLSSSRPPSSSSFASIQGIVSYKRPTIKTDETTPTHYQYTIVLDTFDETTGLPLTISDAPDQSVNLLSSDGTTLGTQKQTAQSVSCSSPSFLVGYDALMLFDRSGSMSSNDPYDDSLAAAKKFINKIGSKDGIKIAQFSGNGNTGVQFLSAAFSGDITYLQTLISAIDNPSGGTPLWDSMNTSLNEFASSTNQKALLTFSDGADTGSNTNSNSVKISAINKGVKVFSINLRNSNTQNVDDIAFSTGGNVFSTNDAKKLIDYYGILGNLLSGNTSTCTVTIDVNFTPASGVGEVGYGPAGSSIIDTPLTVSLSNNGGQRQITTPITFPLYPGRKIGQTENGTSIFEQDIAASGNSSTCISKVGSSVKNNCVEPIYTAICESGNIDNCSKGLIAPQALLALPINSTKGITYSTCPWSSSNISAQYVPAIYSGTAPNSIFSINKPSLDSFSCTNARRFGL